MARTLIHVIGAISQSPTWRTTAKGDILSLSVAETLKYRTQEHEGISRFFDTVIWDTEVGKAVARDLYKGAKVAIEGTYEEQEYDGKVRHSLYAYKIWPLDSCYQKPKDGDHTTGTRQAAPVEKSAGDDW
jgi:single-stranded DNA-binding protein